MLEFPVPEALTFDDVLLVPAHSRILRASRHENPPDAQDHAQRSARVVRHGHGDGVELAVALAQEGGVGIIHKNLPIDEQASEIDKVKRSESGMIVDPSP
jgi:IMP dehydrogenase